jgi:hypothetical protein
MVESQRRLEVSDVPHCPSFWTAYNLNLLVRKQSSKVEEVNLRMSESHHVQAESDEQANYTR